MQASEGDIMAVGTVWMYILRMIIEVGCKDRANQVFASCDPMQIVSGVVGETFGAVRLSATGQEPATHYGSSGSVTQAEWSAIRDAMIGHAEECGIGEPPAYALVDVRLDDFEADSLLATNMDPAPVDGSWEAFLSAAGLVRIV